MTKMQTEREREERCSLFNLTWLSLVVRFVSLLQFCHRSQGSLKVTKYFLSSLCVFWLSGSLSSPRGSLFALATLSSLSPLSARDPAPLCNRVPVYLARAHSSRERERERGRERERERQNWFAHVTSLVQSCTAAVREAGASCVKKRTWYVCKDASDLPSRMRQKERQEKEREKEGKESEMLE